MSTTSESQPRLAINSAEKLLGMPHHPLITALPAAQASLTRFARIPVLHSSTRYPRSRQLRPPLSSARRRLREGVRAPIWSDQNDLWIENMDNSRHVAAAEFKANCL